VEIDIVMNANTPLWKAHDISQQLQDKIEVLPNVERAFVHVDHETSHTPVCSWLSSIYVQRLNLTSRNIGKPNLSFYDHKTTTYELSLPLVFLSRPFFLVLEL